MISSDPLFHKPKSIIAAKNLLYASMFLGVINYVIGRITPGLQANSQAEGLITLIITLVVVYILTRQVGLGKKWARVVLLVLFILGLIAYPFVIVPIFQANLLIGMLSVLLTILQFMALIFLFTRDSTIWFNKIGAEVVA